MRFIVLIAAALISGSPALAQPTSASSVSQTVTVEHYYRIKWGSLGEFRELYKRNHAPILEAMKAQGFITNIVSHEPFTHLAGGQRWDLRVTITYRDSQSAVVVGGAYDDAAEKTTARLYPDRAKLKAEEARRFSLVEEHWDVLVTKSSD